MAINLGGDNEKKKFATNCASIIQALKEVETLKEDIKAYLTSIKDEFGLKPALVRKAIKAHMNQNLNEVQEETRDVETIVDVLGKASNKL